MARVSRKNASQAPIMKIERIYNTALYIRLSKEDSGKSSGEVIDMQEFMVEQYVKAQKDMRLISIYCDNGFTGTNFERPQFERMMNDIRERKIDCIVVKDLSRFGRDYIETGYFLEKIFPYLDVRFVAINDNYDTLHNANEMVVSLKNIVNSFYAKDISKKSSTALHQKQKNGEYIGGWPPFGYMKSTENKNLLIIDPLTAPYVKEIFKWKSEGMGYVKIARRLNELGVTSPSMHNYRSGRYNMKCPTEGNSIWKSHNIRLIISNFTYTGNMTQRKTKTSLCEGISRSKVSKDNYVVVYDTHEPIIEAEMFKKLEIILGEYHTKITRYKYPFIKNIFKGKIFCSDCGTKMMRCKNVSKQGKINYRFFCKTHEEKLTAVSCTRKRVGEPELIEAILLSIKVQIQLGFSLEEKLNKIKCKSEYKNHQKKEVLDLSKIEKALEKNVYILASLFESYTDEKINIKEYNRMKLEYTKQAEKLLEQKKKLLMTHTLDKKDLSSQNEWLTFRKHEYTNVLNREIIVKLIDRIVVSNYNDVEIVWNFIDEFTLLKLFAERGKFQ